ncbi:hypothetical protein Q7P35_007413 [Cladosporium inversicolor]
MAGKTAFFNELQTAFGYGSEKMEAEQALQSIQQRGPVSKYRAEFQTLVVKTNWDNEAITSHFYRGLKDIIKDEIAKRDTRLTTKNGFRTTKGKTAESDENAKVSDETRVESMRATQQGRGVYDTTGTITPEQDSHAALTWIACYEDGCAIHYSDKYGSGYPPLQEESSEEEGEASETESVEESVGVTEFTRTFYSDDPMLRLLEAVADSRPLLLLWDSEGKKQMIDESELWELFTRMRKVLWDVPYARKSIDYHRIVQEFPPLGSRFTPQGGYSTLDSVNITRTMRVKVIGIKNEYVTEEAE